VLPHYLNERIAVTAIQTLSVKEGRYAITTRNGTQHVIDFDSHTATRLPAAGRNFSDPDLTPDGAPFRYWWITDPIEVGKSILFENRDEWRVTSVVVSIERQS
jgi:hypothetical protein